MIDRRRSQRRGRASGWIAGNLAATLLMLALLVAMSRLVVLWCPRGDHCAAIAQLLFWSGMAVSAAIAVRVGIVVHDLVARWIARRPC